MSSALLAGINPVVLYVIIGILAVLVLALIAYEVARNVYKRTHRSGEGKPVSKPRKSVEKPRETIIVTEEPVAEAQEMPAEDTEPAFEEEQEPEEPEEFSPEPVPQEPVPDNAKVIFAPVNRLVTVRYDKSFTARLMQASEQSKGYYNQIKNELLRYKRVKSRISWRRESFRLGRDLMAKLEIRGKTLCLYLALNSADYADSKYFVEDASDRKMNLPVPTLYRIKNDRRARYAIELIAEVFRTRETKYTETEPVDFAADFPYDDTSSLVTRGLVKVIEVRAGESFRSDDEDEEYYEEAKEEKETGISLEEAEREMRDDEAAKLVRESGNVSMRGKMAIVNVDTLGEYFSDGETVTFDDMKERIPFLNKSAVYVKVLARGRLSKSLVVEADDFSLGAVKMIVLAGGTVYRKRSE